MAPAPQHKSVLLIGASRGLGLAIAEQYLSDGARVTATVRAAQHTALHDLQSRFADRLEIEAVDITEQDQIVGLHERLRAKEFDLLFVNAGVTNNADETSANVSTEEFSRLMLTNALGPMHAIEVLGDLVAETGTIAIMSSGQGSVTNNERGGFEIYRASKAALNQLMRSYAARHRDDPRTLLLMAPGWVQTELGGPDAKLTIDESIPNLVRTIDEQRRRGGLQFLDYLGQNVPW